MVNFTLKKSCFFRKKDFGRILFSHQILTFFYGIFLFMYEIRFLQEYISIFHPLLVVWSGLVFLYDIFVRKMWKDIIYWKILLFFIISAGITAILTIETGILSNIKAWVLTSLPLCVFYPLCLIENEEKNYLKTFLVTLSGSAIISVLASLIAIWMYLIRLSGTITLWGITNKIGIQNYIPNDPTSAIILYGIYVDTNHAAIYALCFIFYGIALLLFAIKSETKNKRKNWLIKSFAVLDILVQICYFPLANSRGGWLSFGFSLFIVGFLFIFCRFEQNKRIYKRIFVSLLGAVGLVIASCIGFWIIRTGMSEISVKIETYITERKKSNIIQKTEEVKINKEGGDIGVEKKTEEIVRNIDGIEGLQDGSENNDVNTPPNDGDSIKGNSIIENNTIDNLKKFDVEENSFDKKNENFGAGRLEIWKDTIKLYMHKPIMGEGPGNTWYYAPIYSPDGVISQKDAEVHNSYLDLLLDYGVIGTILLMTFWILCVKRILQYLFKRKKQIDIFVYLGSLIVLISASGAFFISSAFINVTALYFVMLVTTGFIMKKSTEKVKE